MAARSGAATRNKMSDASSIEWTDATWNPVRGCKKISPGCAHCYAETFAERWRGTPGHPYEQGFDLRLVAEKLTQPLLWARPRTIFVNSMSDLFQRGIPLDFVDRVFDVMTLADWHTYQLLTKRADRMLDIVSNRYHGLVEAKHIWLGVSVENRKHGTPRISHLRNTPAAVRFLSIEPLLEDLGDLRLDGIDWVIVGGESGPGSRPMKIEWVRSIREQCKEQSVPFFFKQWGGVRKKQNGRVLDGRTHDQMPPIISKPQISTLEIRERIITFSRNHTEVA